MRSALNNLFLFAKFKGYLFSRSSPYTPSSQTILHPDSKSTIAHVSCATIRPRALTIRYPRKLGCSSCICKNGLCAVCGPCAVCGLHAFDSGKHEGFSCILRYYLPPPFCCHTSSQSEQCTNPAIPVAAIYLRTLRQAPRLARGK